MPVDKLILLPVDASTGIDDCSELAACLQRTGLVDAPRPFQGGLFYPTGDQFLQLVSFLGCSPSIELDPPEDSSQLAQSIAEGGFVHVQTVCGSELRLRADGKTRAPRCPNCRQLVKNWATRLRQWQANPAESVWSCRACDYSGELTDWVFGKTCGFGKVFVEISGIYPAEAVPTTALLQPLADLTGCPWRYIYIKE